VDQLLAEKKTIEQTISGFERYLEEANSYLTSVKAKIEDQQTEHQKVFTLVQEKKAEKDRLGKKNLSLCCLSCPVTAFDCTLRW